MTASTVYQTEISFAGVSVNSPKDKTQLRIIVTSTKNYISNILVQSTGMLL